MLVLGLLLSSLLGMVSPSLLEVSEDVAGEPIFDQVSHSGNGCPQGSATTITGDWKSATIRFGEFGLDTQDGPKKSENCAVHLTGKGARVGYNVALTDVDYWGDLLLRNGSTFTWFGTQFRSENAALTDTVSSRISNTGGLLKSSFSAHGEAASPVWSACVGEGGNIPGILNFNLRGAIVGENGGRFELKGAKLKFTWKKCYTAEEPAQ